MRASPRLCRVLRVANRRPPDPLRRTATEIAIIADVRRARAYMRGVRVQLTPEQRGYVDALVEAQAIVRDGFRSGARRLWPTFVQAYANNDAIRDVLRAWR